MGKKEKKIFSILHPREDFKCLDLQCLKGKLLSYLAQNMSRTSELWGLYLTQDSYEKDRRKLMQNYDNIQLYNASPLDIPASDNFFDCVIGLELFYNISNREKLFQEVFRVLKPLGRLVLVDHSGFLQKIDLKTELLTVDFQDILISEFRYRLLYKRTLVEAIKPYVDLMY
ncbi:MAG: class I SAM-dependent methyltransferase [Promethearchaeota archaeon]